MQVTSPCKIEREEKIEQTVETHTEEKGEESVYNSEEYESWINTEHIVPQTVQRENTAQTTEREKTAQTKKKPIRSIGIRVLMIQITKYVYLTLLLAVVMIIVVMRYYHRTVFDNPYWCSVVEHSWIGKVLRWIGIQKKPAEKLQYTKEMLYKLAVLNKMIVLIGVSVLLTALYAYSSQIQAVMDLSEDTMAHMVGPTLLIMPTRIMTLYYYRNTPTIHQLMLSITMLEILYMSIMLMMIVIGVTKNAYATSLVMLTEIHDRKFTHVVLLCAGMDIMRVIVMMMRTKNKKNIPGVCIVLLCSVIFVTLKMMQKIDFTTIVAYAKHSNLMP